MAPTTRSRLMLTDRPLRQRNHETIPRLPDKSLTIHQFSVCRNSFKLWTATLPRDREIVVHDSAMALSHSGCHDRPRRGPRQAFITGGRVSPKSNGPIITLLRLSWSIRGQLFVSSSWSYLAVSLQMLQRHRTRSAPASTGYQTLVEGRKPNLKRRESSDRHYE